MENWQDEIIKAQTSQKIGFEMSMENSDISIFLKSLKENLISYSDKDSFEKSWSSDLQSKFPSGSWKTINGARVFVNNGKVVAGLDGFNDEIDKFFDGKGKKESTKKEKKETSKPQLSPDQKKVIDSISKLTAQSKELNKKQVYNPKTFEISKETLKDMVVLSSKIDEKVLLSETREKLEEIKEELDNFVTKDIYVQMSSGRKGKYLNRDKDFESDLEDKETLSDKIKFIVDEYDKEDGDGNTEIVGIDEYFPKVKDLLVDIVKEYSNKKTTDILNYKLF